MKKLTLAATFLLSFGFNSLAMANDAPAEKPSTKVEQFSAKTGAVIIKGFTEIGVINSRGNTLEVSSVEFFDAGSPNNIVKGVAIRVEQKTRFERSNTSFIDFDEIDSLIKGIDYISKIKSDATKQQNFEAKYKTKGSFEIIVFDNSQGGLSAMVASGNIGKASIFIDMTDLEKLRQLVLDAKAKL